MNYDSNRTDADGRFDVFVRDNDPMLVRGNIYDVPPGFFDSEKARMTERLHKSQDDNGRRMSRRRVLRFSAIAAAACVAIAATFPLMISFVADTDNGSPAAQPAQKALAQSVTHNKTMGDNSVIASADAEWTQYDEVENADLLLWLY